MTKEFDPGGLIGEAMSRRSQAISIQASQQSAEEAPCPPDQELDALFREFARRMPARLALPFVKIEFVEAKKRLRGKGSQKKVSRQVGKGWPLVGRGQRTFEPSREKGAVYSPERWKGMAVDTSGSLWFALSHKQAPYDGSELIVGFPGPGEPSNVLHKFYSPGRPQGPSLRKEIAVHTGLVAAEPSAELDRLPMLVAEDIGVTLQKMGQ